MAQRVQTIYLLLVTALLIISMCLPVGSFIGADAAMYTFKPLGVEQNGMFYSTWGVFGILLLSAIVAFIIIFLFRNCMLQIRMSIFNSILLIGYCLTLLVFMFVLKKDLNAASQISWALCLPLISIILDYLAIHVIGRDEMMVKVADRLR